jgi:hypothetical protein
MRVGIVLRSAEIYPVFFDVSSSFLVVGLSEIITWAFTALGAGRLDFLRFPLEL